MESPLCKPSAVLSMDTPSVPLRLESAACPVPVKKQRKYNLARWAVTGRDNIAINAACERLYATLTEAGSTVLYDDRDERPGAKFADMDLVGLPWQLVVGPRGLASGTVELKRRSTGEKQELSIESALARLTA